MNAVNVLEKDMVYLVGMTGVSMKKGKLDGAPLSGKLTKTDFPKLKEPVPHLRFGDNILIQEPNMLL